MTTTAAATSNCPICSHSTQPDTDPSTFAYYCPNCGYRQRIGQPVAKRPATANAQDAAWRKAHGFSA